MAKISQLPLLSAPTGRELVPVVSADGVTRQAEIGGLIDNALGAAPLPFYTDGALRSGGRWLGDIAPPIGPSLTFARYDYELTAQIAPGKEYFFICEIPGYWVKDTYLAINILIASSHDDAFPSADATGLRGIVNWDGLQQEFASLSYETLSSRQRRYHGVVQVSGGLAKNLLFQIHNNAPGDATIEATAFLATASEQRIVDIDYRASDTQAASDLPLTIPGRPRPCNGNLAGGQFAFAFGASAEFGTVVAFPDEKLSAIEIDYALRLSAGQTCFWSPATMPVCPVGRRVVRSLIVIKNGPGAWPTGDDLRVVLYETDNFGGATQSVSIAEHGRFAPLGDGRRRYWVAFDASIRARRALIQVGGVMADTTFFVTGFAENEFDFAATDLAWRDWDLASQRNHERRIAAIEDRLGGQNLPSDPGLMLATSYDVIANRPVKLHRDGFTTAREASAFEVTAIGRNGDRAGIATAAPLLELRAEIFAGPALFRAKRKGVDDYDAWGAEVTVYGSTATRSGSPNILLFGDSLPYQYQTAELARKLRAIGLTPTFLGSYPAHGNYDGSASAGDPAFVPAEARSSIQAINADYRVRRAQVAGTFFDFFPVRDDGGSGAAFEATLSGGVVNALRITAAGNGYPDGRIPLLIDSPAIGDANRRALGWVTFTGGQATRAELEFGGSGYAAAPGVGLIPTIAEYSALPALNDFDQRWRFLPWLRLATDADDPAKVHNGYVVDITKYLDRLGMAKPDLVIIGWGTNDIRQGTSAADTLASLRNFADAVRAALPNAHILMTVNGMGERATLWPGVCALWRAMFPVFGGQEASRMWLRPLFQTMDPKLVYGMTTTAIDPGTGIQTLSIKDSVHPLRVGASLAAEMLAAWVACRT